MQSILLMGRPGSGKGTQAKLLEDNQGFEIIVAGNLLREKANQNSFTGRQLKKYMNAGHLLPSIVVSSVWYEKLDKLKNNNDIKKSIVFDGFARKLIEAELLLQALDWFELGSDFKVIYIDISAQESGNRIRQRKMCDKCQAIFMANYQKEECDKCGGALIMRGDQTEKAILKREQEFMKETMPVLEYFENKGLLEKVDGEQFVEDVFSDIKKLL